VPGSTPRAAARRARRCTFSRSKTTRCRSVTHSDRNARRETSTRAGWGAREPRNARPRSSWIGLHRRRVAFLSRGGSASAPLPSKQTTSSYT
jgi:hypothetical protein